MDSVSGVFVDVEEVDAEMAVLLLLLQGGAACWGWAGVVVVGAGVVVASVVVFASVVVVVAGVAVVVAGVVAVVAGVVVVVAGVVVVVTFSNAYVIIGFVVGTIDIVVVIVIYVFVDINVNKIPVADVIFVITGTIDDIFSSQKSINSSTFAQTAPKIRNIFCIEFTFKPFTFVTIIKAIDDTSERKIRIEGERGGGWGGW